jgi:hypothetical protein
MSSSVGSAAGSHGDGDGDADADVGAGGAGGAGGADGADGPDIAGFLQDGFDTDLPQFDPGTIRPDATVLVVGQRGIGKTKMMLYLLGHLAPVLDMCVCMCPSRDTREEYEQHIPKAYIYPGLDSERLDHITTTQRKIAETGQENLLRVGIILDDCAFDKKAFTTETMRYLLMNGRHEKFFFMNGVQYAVDFPKSLRQNIDIVVAFPEVNFEFRDPLRRNLLGIFKTDAQLVRAFNALEPYEALVFDQKAMRMKQPYLFYARATYPMPRFCVGKKWWWESYYRHLVREDASEKLREIQAAVAMKSHMRPAASMDATKAGAGTAPSAAGAAACAAAGTTAAAAGGAASGQPVIRRIAAEPRPIPASAMVPTGDWPFTAKPGVAGTATAPRRVTATGAKAKPKAKPKPKPPSAASRPLPGLGALPPPPRL